MTETLSRSDMRTIERAMNNPEWHLPENLYTALPQILINIAVKGSERAQIAAARVLTAMHQQNEDRTPKVAMVAHRHQHEILPVTTGNINERRSQLLARLDNLRRNT